MVSYCIYKSSARQSRVPATVRTLSGISSKEGGAQPPQHCKRMVERAWIQYSWTKLDPKLIKMKIKKSIKNRSKIHQNQLKILQKSTKNRPKIDQKSINIEAWRGSGRILAAKRVLRGVLGFLGGLLGRLGGLFGRLGSKKLAHMAPTWLPKRSQNR